MGLVGFGQLVVSSSRLQFWSLVHRTHTFIATSTHRLNELTHFFCSSTRSNTFAWHSPSCIQQPPSSLVALGTDSVRLVDPVSCHHCHRFRCDWLPGLCRAIRHRCKEKNKLLVQVVMNLEDDVYHLHSPFEWWILDWVVQLFEHIFWEIFTVVQFA
jgi:hypothetical protein